MIIRNDRPCYRVLALHGFFGPDDTLHLTDENGDPAIIYYDGEPNEELEPLNSLATEKMNTYLEKLDTLGKAVAEKLGRPFVGRPRGIDGAIEIATEVQRNNISIMGAKKSVSTIERVEQEIPETGKRGRGRPRKSLNVEPVTIASQAR